MNSEYDSKDFYLTKDDDIIGLHCIGIAGPYEFELINFDGSSTIIKNDFQEIEKWGNKYDSNFNMIGGSFRIFDLTLEDAVKDYESDGWIQIQKSNSETI